MHKKLRTLILGFCMLVCLLFGGLFYSTSYFLVQGNERFALGQYVMSQKIFKQAPLREYVQPYVSFFDQGNAAYANKEYAVAEQQYRNALRSVPQSKRCYVQVSLGYSILAQESNQQSVDEDRLEDASRYFNECLQNNDPNISNQAKSGLSSARSQNENKSDSEENKGSGSSGSGGGNSSGQNSGTGNNKENDGINNPERSDLLGNGYGPEGSPPASAGANDDPYW